MTGRERVMDSLAGKETDRPPFWLRFDHFYRERVAKTKNIEPEKLIDYYGCDAAQVTVAYKPRPRISENEYLDLYGNRITTVHYDGFTDAAVTGPALAEINDANEVTEKHFPDENDVDVPRCAEAAKSARETGRAVYGGMWASMFTGTRNMLGEVRYLTSMYENPRLIKKVIELFTDSCLKINKAYMDACGDYIDIYYFGSDFATQNSLFISPEMFKEFFAPHMKRVAAQAKSYRKPVMYHCCGTVVKLLDMFIECGVEIIDPVQVSALGMSVGEVAAKYKGRVAFHGGVSSQVTFTTGTPEMIREETVRAIKTLGPSRFIVAPDHELIGDVPVENIDAFVDAVKNYNSYK